jgi:hypothetical protein
LQVADRLAPFALEIEDAGRAEPVQELRVEALASLDVAHNRVEMLNPVRLASLDATAAASREAECPARTSQRAEADAPQDQAIPHQGQQTE